MTKSELIESIAAGADISKAAAGRALEAFKDAVVQAVDTDGKLVLNGFVKFEKKERAARTGRNPQTGAAIQIAAKSVITAKSLI